MPKERKIHMAKKTETKEVTLYKNKPLIKQGNVVYLGYRDEDYMIEMEILDTKKNGDIEIASNVLIKLIDNKKLGRDRVVKKAEREDMNKAMDIAAFWLMDALGDEEEA